MKNLQRLFKNASIETEVFLEIPFCLKTLWCGVYLRNLPFISFFTLYYLVFELCTKNCIALFQSCSINFFLYIIRNQNLTNDSPVVRLLAHKRLFAQLMVSFLSFNAMNLIMNVVNTTKKTAFRVGQPAWQALKGEGEGEGKNWAFKTRPSERIRLFAAKNWN